MAKIDPNLNCVTLINTFTVKPENQADLIKVLNEATEHTMKEIDGFISASIHKGLEGDKVTTYAQWKSKAHLTAMYNNPKAKVHMNLCAELAERFEPILYEVNSTHEA